jgi:anionic cell wall polymer biosynthesis LytR-Cps2A-Psr (LCP) family protein
VPGVNDLVRNDRQRTFLIDMMGGVADVTSPQDIAQVARAVAPFVTVDSDLSLMDAVDIAYTMRGLGSGSVTELKIPVYDDTTSGGAAVLRPSEPVDEIVAEFLSKTAADKGTVLGFAG